MTHKCHQELSINAAPETFEDLSKPFLHHHPISSKQRDSALMIHPFPPNPHDASWIESQPLRNWSCEEATSHVLDKDSTMDVKRMWHSRRLEKNPLRLNTLHATGASSQQTRLRGTMLHLLTMPKQFHKSKIPEWHFTKPFLQLQCWQPFRGSFHGNYGWWLHYNNFINVKQKQSTNQSQTIPSIFCPSFGRV
jgi:hypothetical protein